ncbi:uncharacterized protein LOC131596408 [Vicia villosa]|uniref:uncharacterized protein LOC131596408 n=1 Tax=Vicia villosa TaxID=3911 RepID=UPI00273B150C|nr:uncharacterized protein LOC131596408 [Vicia villosa]XP_058725034.1 uncharacterized protein LOC131596408 [Vicia villosa]
MKTLSGRCESSKAISLSKATKILSKFVSADNGASQVISAYLHRASDAFDELNQIHRELKPSQSHRKKSRSQSHTTYDSSERVGEVSVTIVDVKSEIGTKREEVGGENENVDEKLIGNDVKLGRETNGSVVGGSEKLSKKDKQKKNEFGDNEGEGKLPEKEQNRGDEGMVEGKKEIETKISNNGKVAAREKNEIELSQDGEGGTEGKKQKKEKTKKKKEKSLEDENAEEQKQQKDIEKKMSDIVKVENGELVVPQDIEIRSKKRYEGGNENTVLAGEIKTEQRKKKRKNEDAEDRSEEKSKKKMKRKHEDQA